MHAWYNSRKAAQIAAFFAMREGGNIPVLKVVKLIYLAERAFLDAYDASMLNDQLVSMEHGPVNSITLNRINGAGDDGSEWAEFVTDRAFHRISIANKIMTEEALDELSRAELKVLAATWDRFGHMDQWEIRDYTHDKCPEWEDPNFSSQPIPYSRVFKYLGKENPEELDRRIQHERNLASLLNS
jgi:uncharacterized phage-associated protein